MFQNVPRRPKWSRITQNDLLLSLPLTLPLCTGILQYQPSIKMKLKDTSSKHITTHLSLKGTKPLLVQRRSSLHACFQHNQFYVLRSWCMIFCSKCLYTMKRGLISWWTGQHGSFANQNAKSSCTAKKPPETQSCSGSGQSSGHNWPPQQRVVSCVNMCIFASRSASFSMCTSMYYYVFVSCLCCVFALLAWMLLCVSDVQVCVWIRRCKELASPQPKALDLRWYGEETSAQICNDLA
jgi:hypothetical protein